MAYRVCGNDCLYTTTVTHVASYLFCEVLCSEVSNSYPLYSFVGKPVQNSHSTCFRRSQSRRLYGLWASKTCRRVCQCVQLVHVMSCSSEALSFNACPSNVIACTCMYMYGMHMCDAVCSMLARAGRKRHNTSSSK